jgi:alkylhydroperoxidase family enzyme
MDIGSAVGRANGVDENQLRELPNYRSSDAFTDLEKTAVEYAEAMTKTPVEVSDELYERLRRALTDEQIIELTAEIAWENWRARFNHPLGIGSQGFSEGSFCALPERPAA